MHACSEQERRAKAEEARAEAERALGQQAAELERKKAEMAAREAEREQARQAQVNHHKAPTFWVTEAMESSPQSNSI